MKGGKTEKTYWIQVFRIVFVLAFFKLLENKEWFWEKFSFWFSAKCFNGNSNICFKNFWNYLSCTLSFVFVIKFSKLKVHLRKYFSLFFPAITNWGGISFLNAFIDYEGRHSLWSPSFFEVMYFWRPLNFLIPYIRYILQI